MIGRLVHTADFQRMLGTAARCRSAHFAVHHVSGRPHVGSKRSAESAPDELSTVHSPIGADAVDNLACAHWVGCVVPKRHARRSVTRSLFKRQIRAALERHAKTLPGGLWLVRLRSPFPRESFPAAASQALRRAAGAELDGLFARAAA